MSSSLLKHWSWKKAADDKWVSCKHDSAVTEIFTDLRDHGVIQDPFQGDNEKHLQWVGETDWDYKCEFKVDIESTSGVKNSVHLVFEGLDNYASVYLNGFLVLESDNMFHIHRVDITNHPMLKENSINILLIRFKSAYKESIRLEKEHGAPRFVWFGDSARLYTRKAQYHYGWDWGPVFLTCGPYRPVKLDIFEAKIQDVYIGSVVNDDMSADLRVELTASSSYKRQLNAKVTVRSSNYDQLVSEIVKIETEEKSETTPILAFKLKDPKLWYPRNYGPQNMYLCDVILSDGDTILDKTTQKFGIRKVELIEHEFEDQQGSSFFFRVNNIPIYINGSNWIPAHSFTTQLKYQDYRKWIELVVKGNQNMIRIWGGGLFEEDALYDACDEAGILVWQDFLFACGQYPYYKELTASITKECEDQLKRLRKYCSIIIYAGNNEDYVIAKSASLTWDQAQDASLSENSNFPARIYYEDLLPNLVRKYCPSVVYRYGSPYGGLLANDTTVGDVHQWDVWHGTQERYQDWPRLAGRFVSEFGMLALPSLKTLSSAISGPDLYPQSYVMDFHNKAKGFEKRLYSYVFENITVRDMSIESWIYATQLMQAECLGLAYRCWRRNWKGPGKEYSAGALVWQLNDCWPVTSWSICDFNKVPKLAYFAIKRESAEISIGVYGNAKEVVKDPPQKAAWLKEYRHIVGIWGTNFTLSPIKNASFVTKIFDSATGDLLKELPKKSVNLDYNRSTEFFEEEVSETGIVQAILYDDDNKLISQSSYWPQPLKYLKLAEPNVKAEIRGFKIIVSTDKPVKGVELIIKRDGKRQYLEISDNGFDLFPGYTHTVEVTGLMASSSVEVNYYGKI